MSRCQYNNGYQHHKAGNCADIEEVPALIFVEWSESANAPNKESDDNNRPDNN